MDRLYPPQPRMKLVQVRKQVGWWQRCESCGKRFSSEREDARSCSAACQKALQRARVAKQEQRRAERRKERQGSFEERSL